MRFIVLIGWDRDNGVMDSPSISSSLMLTNVLYFDLPSVTASGQREKRKRKDAK